MNNPSREQHTQSLADYLPNGRLFEAKNVNDSNFRQLIRGIAGELFTAQGYLVTLEEEYFPDDTILFLVEWERALGIPDICFSGAGTVLERRRDVLVKLVSLGVQTAADFETLGDIFGTPITVTPLAEEAFPPYDVPFFVVGLEQGRFVFIVTGAGLSPVLECLLNRQAHANGAIIFRDTV